MAENNNYRDVIEVIIDKIGLKSTLEIIVDICYLKSEHLNNNWQDKYTAEIWEKAAERIFNASSRMF
jgi:hypothetical protein